MVAFSGGGVLPDLPCRAIVLREHGQLFFGPFSGGVGIVNAVSCLAILGVGLVGVKR